MNVYQQSLLEEILEELKKLNTPAVLRNVSINVHPANGMNEERIREVMRKQLPVVLTKYARQVRVGDEVSVDEGSSWYIVSAAYPVRPDRIALHSGSKGLVAIVGMDVEVRVR